VYRRWDQEDQLGLAIMYKWTIYKNLSSETVLSKNYVIPNFLARATRRERLDIWCCIKRLRKEEQPILTEKDYLTMLEWDEDGRPDPIPLTTGGKKITV